MPYPPIPSEIAQELDSLRVAAAAAYQRQDWEAAARRFEEAYEFLMAQQRRFGRRFHKGWELYNAGVARLRGGQAGGMERILVAYAEDILSATPGEEDNADIQPARLSFAGTTNANEFLEPIKAAAFERKQRTPPCLDPHEIYALAETSFPQARPVDAATQQLKDQQPKRRTIEGIQTPLERRCFIGCNYFSGGPNFEELKRTIVDEGFEPIVALEFNIAGQDVHHHSLLLLHECRKAVFEITFPAGQLMELERCRDYGIPPLILRHIMQSADPSLSAVSAMIASMTNHEVKTYADTKELRSLVQAYLRA